MRNKIPKDLHKKIIKRIQDIHMSKSKEHFEDIQARVLEYWRSKDELSEFAEYFSKNWLRGNNSLWQIWCRPCGLSSTNNSLESYNNLVKRFFTQRQLLNLISMLECWRNIVLPYEEERRKEFKSYVTVPRRTLTISRKLLSTEKSRFIKIGELSYEYINEKMKRYIMHLDPLDCSCSWFIKTGTCWHSTAAALLSNHSIPGLLMKQTLVSKKRKRVHESSFDSSNDSAIFGEPIAEEPIVAEPIAEEPTVELAVVKKRKKRKIQIPATQIVTRSRTRKFTNMTQPTYIQDSANPIVIVKRRRGRPPKVGEALSAE